MDALGFWLFAAFLASPLIGLALEGLAGPMPYLPPPPAPPRPRE